MFGVRMMAFMEFEDVGEESFLVAEFDVRIDGVRVDIFQPREVASRGITAGGRL